MIPLTLQEIARLITQKTGICFREQDYASLSRKLEQRIQALGFRDLERYYHFLNQDLEAPVGKLGWWQRPQISGAEEWQNLVDLITVRESYFFRDRNQMTLLAKTLIPLIMEQRGQVTLGRPRLRLWSAGCSTGEEPYSMAILLLEMLGLGEVSQWEVLILGTDICETSLARARSGLFSSWSFRQFDPALKEKYFQPHPQGWQINPEVQRLVTFHQNNLLADAFPQVGGPIFEMDLILCRNVFIYFSPSSVDQVLGKFVRTLTPQGFLVTGHAELQGRTLHSLRPLSFPESVVYQRSDTPLPPAPLLTALWQPPGQSSPQPRSPDPTFPAAVTPPPRPVSVLPNQAAAKPGTLPSSVPSGLLQEARTLKQRQNYTGLIRLLQPLLPQAATPRFSPSSPASPAPSPRLGDRSQQLEAHLLLAQAHANLGQVHEAQQLCQAALKLDPCSVQIYTLLAQIAEETGDLEGAKLFLKRVIYLDPDAIMAYFNLSLIYEQENSLDRARKVQTTTWDLVKRLPPHTIVDPEHQRTAQELQTFLERKLPLA